MYDTVVYHSAVSTAVDRLFAWLGASLSASVVCKTGRRDRERVSLDRAVTSVCQLRLLLFLVGRVTAAPKQSALRCVSRSPFRTNKQ